MRYSKYDYLEGRFYQMPEALFMGEYHEQLGNDAKVLYSLLKSRHSLSITNNWVDEKDNIYFIFTREEMEKMLKVSAPTLRKAIKELKDIGLMEEVRQGVNKANLIYLNKPKLEYCDSNQDQDTLEDPVDEVVEITDQEQNDVTDENQQETVEVANTAECKNLSVQENSGVKESFSQECENFTLLKNSGVKESFSQECKNLSPRYINNNYIENKNISNLILSYEEMRDEFRRQIDYEVIKTNLLIERKSTNVLDEIVSVATELLISSKESIVIARETKAMDYVKSRFKCLNKDHITYVLSSFEKTNKEMKNPIAVIRTSLYNALNSVNTSNSVNNQKRNSTNNSFNNFEQRTYDFDELEKQLLSSRR